MEILKIKNLNLEFKFGKNRYKALYNVNLTLKKGEILALVGESGCGKTMTAMSVLRLLPQGAQIISGEILYDNKDILKLSEPEIRKIRGGEIALIPQDPMTSLNPLFTIGDQLKEVIELHRGKKGREADKIAAEVLDAVRIPNAKERLKSYPHEFSGGMRQRVIIAAALACNSKVIIADEPTTALDVTVQSQITDLLKEIQRENKTSFLFVSHDFGLVHEFADNIAVMYAGHVVETAKADILFKNPKHPYTNALIKALPDLNSTELYPINGQPPSIRDEFKGCSFAPRCEKKFEYCEQNIPELYSSEDTQCACFIFGK